MTKGLKYVSFKGATLCKFSHLVHRDFRKYRHIFLSNSVAYMIPGAFKG